MWLKNTANGYPTMQYNRSIGRSPPLDDRHPLDDKQHDARPPRTRTSSAARRPLKRAYAALTRASCASSRAVPGAARQVAARP
jgi:hypothetical protein